MTGVVHIFIADTDTSHQARSQIEGGEDEIPETSKAEVLVVEWKEDSSNEFKYAVEEAGLRGLLFQTIWED